MSTTHDHTWQADPELVYRQGAEQIGSTARLRNVDSPRPAGAGCAGEDVAQVERHMRHVDTSGLTDEQRAEHASVVDELAWSSSSLLDSAAVGMGIVSGHRARLQHIEGRLYGLLGSVLEARR